MALCSTVLNHCLVNCQSEPQNNWRNILEPQSFYLFIYLGCNGTSYKMFTEILHSPLSAAVGEAGQEGCASWPVTEASCRHSWSTYRKGSQQVGNTHCTSLVSGTRAQHKYFCTPQCSLLPYFLGASPLTPVLQSPLPSPLQSPFHSSHPHISLPADSTAPTLLKIFHSFSLVFLFKHTSPRSFTCPYYPNCPPSPPSIHLQCPRGRMVPTLPVSQAGNKTTSSRTSPG